MGASHRARLGTGKILCPWGGHRHIWGNVLERRLYVRMANDDSRFSLVLLGRHAPESIVRMAHLLVPLYVHPTLGRRLWAHVPVPGYVERAARDDFVQAI